MENPAAQSAAPASESPGSRNIRPIEDTVHTDFRHAMSYGSYLDLDRLLETSTR